jgi:hypothetical protein
MKSRAYARVLTFALAVMTFAAASQGLKAADAVAQCPVQNATLRRSYMVTGGGSVVGFGPIAAVGVINYDGKGNCVNTFTSSAGSRAARWHAPTP